MLIGPLTYKSPIVAFNESFTNVMYRRSLAVGNGLCLPDSIDDDGTVLYAREGAEFVPMVDIHGEESLYPKLYSNLDLMKPERSVFMNGAADVESILGMGTADIAASIRRPRFYRHSIPTTFDQMLKLFDGFGKHSLAELLEIVDGEGEWDEIISIDEKMLAMSSQYEGSWIALAAEYARDTASASSRSPLNADGREAAVFAFISAILFLCAGDDKDMDEAVEAFHISAKYFSMDGLFVSAAMVSEIASSLPSSKGNANISLAHAAGYWLQAATSMREADPAGHAIAIYRGLKAALFFESFAPEVRQTRELLFELSAEMHLENERYEEAADDMLRLAFDSLKFFTASPDDWRLLADRLERAAQTFEMSEFMYGIVKSLGVIVGLARDEADELEAEIGPLDRAIGERPHDADALWKRGVAKIGHGNIGGAIQDLGRARDLMGDRHDPLFASDVGLAYHSLGYMRKMEGRTSVYDEILEYALKFFDEALRMAEEKKKRNEWKKEDDAILHARRGALYASLERQKEAAAELERALLLAPDDMRGDIREYMRSVGTLRPLFLHAARDNGRSP